MSRFGQPDKKMCDDEARKHGWYTSTNHPPLPFLAMVADDPRDLARCNDQGEYSLFEGNVEFQRVALIREIYPKADRSAFFPFDFARPYKGPHPMPDENCLNVLHVQQEAPKPAELIEDRRKLLGIF